MKDLAAVEVAKRMGAEMYQRIMRGRCFNENLVGIWVPKVMREATGE
jgi:hypothetical protein